MALKVSASDLSYAAHEVTPLRRISHCRPVVPALQHRWNHPTYFVRLVRILDATDRFSINASICSGAAEDMAHSSLRFGIGRFTTEAEIDFVVNRIVRVVNRLRDMRSAILVCLPWLLLTCILVRCGKWCKRELISTPSTGHSIDIIEDDILVWLLRLLRVLVILCVQLVRTVDFCSQRMLEFMRNVSGFPPLCTDP